MSDDKIKCPKCGSEQIHASKRGWSPLWGVFGMSRVVLTCLKCNHNFRPGNVPGPIEGLFEQPSGEYETVSDRLNRAKK